ncbi:MAG: amidohydrolase family protein, partial [Deltaproteobacteria bacterium]|nr:amidohydrolase family protein [Deltaproteobacteria bacterium]
VLRLGEVVSWLRLVQGDPDLATRIDLTLNQGKIVHGHTAGARDRRLNAIAAASVSSCHEPISGEDALARLRLGYWTMLREGSFRQDLEATLKPLLAAGVDTGRLILVTDGMAPDDVAAHGHMDHVIRRAVACGLSPVRAIQAATLHPASYSGLEQYIGGLAPGRFADFVLLDDLETVHVGATYIGGERVAEAGETNVAVAPPGFPGGMGLKTAFRLPVTAEDMRIRCEKPRARIRVMDLINQTITRERVVEVPCAGGVVSADVEADLLKVAVFDRRVGFSPTFGFVRGLGTDIGAVGTTVNLDEYTLLVAGSSDYDMAYCANLLLEYGGGIAVVDRGRVLEEIPFPIGGLFSLEPWRDVGERLASVQRILKEHGSAFPKPLYALCFLTFVTLPELRITGRGLVRAKERRIVPLLAE